DTGCRLAEPGDALSWLAERSVRAATAAAGGRWGRLASAMVDATVPCQASGPWVVHSVVSPAGDAAVRVRTTGTRPAAAQVLGSWLPHGIVTLGRPDRGPTAYPPADEAAAWGRVVRTACAAVDDAARAEGRENGWVHEF